MIPGVAQGTGEVHGTIAGHDAKCGQVVLDVSAWRSEFGVGLLGANT
ncbi:MAG TPA: hypothetical protein VKR27_05225 [Acidimicrobiales bacterium]|nr:hypothetical protein [Acidimicrobiales bacterium]